jgi:hypothetical protein
VIVLLIVVGIFVAVVVASIIGARRGTPPPFAADDFETEKARSVVRVWDSHGPMTP